MPNSTDRSAKKPLHLRIDRRRFEYVFRSRQDQAGRYPVRARLLVLPFILDYCPDQLDESRNDANNQSGQV